MKKSKAFWIVTTRGKSEVLHVVDRYGILWAGRPCHAKNFTPLDGYIFTTESIGPFSSHKATRSHASEKGVELLPP